MPPHHSLLGDLDLPKVLGEFALWECPLLGAPGWLWSLKTPVALPGHTIPARLRNEPGMCPWDVESQHGTSKIDF